MMTKIISSAFADTAKNGGKYVVVPEGLLSEGDEIVLATKMREKGHPQFSAPWISAEQIADDTWLLKQAARKVTGLGKVYEDRGYNVDSEDALSMGITPGTYEETYVPSLGRVQRAYLSD